MNQVISKEDFDSFEKKVKKDNKTYEVYSDDEYNNEYYPYNKSDTNSKLDMIIDESNIVSFEIISHSLKNGYFNFIVKHEMYEDSKDHNYTRKEFNYSSFSRSFVLPEAANREDINATYVDGVLIVVIPKKDEAKMLPKSIQVS